MNNFIQSLQTGSEELCLKILNQAFINTESLKHFLSLSNDDETISLAITALVSFIHGFPQHSDFIQQSILSLITPLCFDSSQPHFTKFVLLFFKSLSEISLVSSSFTSSLLHSLNLSQEQLTPISSQNVSPSDVFLVQLYMYFDSIKNPIRFDFCDFVFEPLIRVKEYQKAEELVIQNDCISRFLTKFENFIDNFDQSNDDPNLGLITSLMFIYEFYCATCQIEKLKRIEQLGLCFFEKCELKEMIKDFNSELEIIRSEFESCIYE
ncbi:hypothetical protein RCL1_001703 [Eukaryota sp. TZLM3-RCL]